MVVAPTAGPECNLHVSVPAASRARLSVSLARREKPGRYESRRTETQPCQRAEDVRINPSDRMLDNAGYAYLPARNSERDRGRFRAIGGEGHGGIAPA